MNKFYFIVLLTLCWTFPCSAQSPEQRPHTLDKYDEKFEVSPYVPSHIRIVPKEAERLPLGEKPNQTRSGKVQCVVNWLQDNLNDPYSMKILRWYPVVKETHDEQPYWVVRFKMRAKNAYGAYVLSDQAFLIRSNKVVYVY